MTGWLLRILYYLVVAFVVGTLALAVTGYRKRPVPTTLILGFIGVWIGDFLAHRFHLPAVIPSVFGISLFWAVAGAAAFIAGYALLRGKW